MVTNRPHDDVFRALSDSTRREILEVLAIQPSPVKRLAERFEVTRPAISRHLRLLKEADLVEMSTIGRENIYRVRTKALRELESWLQTFWGRRLTKLKQIAEATKK